MSASTPSSAIRAFARSTRCAYSLAGNSLSPGWSVSIASRRRRSDRGGGRTARAPLPELRQDLVRHQADALVPGFVVGPELENEMGRALFVVALDLFDDLLGRTRDDQAVRVVARRAAGLGQLSQIFPDH